ncbi:MAG: GPW/gp25 family protein [Firmicutes bacterium]|nr:GPW/gp25 family protein [Bacillota bacterium]
MQYEIDTSDTQVNWKAKGDERIVQNVQNLISTFRYEVGFDRTKGVDPRLLDMESNEAMALYISEIYRLVETHEPRAKVIKVTPNDITPYGDVNAKVVIEIL